MSLNTLSANAAGAERHIETPVSYPLSKEHFLEARALFKKAAHAKRLSAASICAWHILSGQDAKKGFTPITNPVKLANGAHPMGAYHNALGGASRLSLAALEPWAEALIAAGCAPQGWKWSGSHPILDALSAAQD